ncbi:MAG: hypothetical protein NWR72_12115 [Bacteroidia bacterium]|nr:hypothetical protein [Bacteroidia bacterium]
MNSIQVPEAMLQSLTHRITAKLLQENPLSTGYITGEDIKSFAAHNQINSFLLFQIFQVWDQRVQQLKHPFFDFASEEVETVLDNLKNELAHHIKIDAASFEALVERAVANTLGFIFDPETSFKGFFFAQAAEISLEQFEKYAAFFSDWDFVVNSILRYHQKHETETIEWNGFSEKMKRVVEIYEQKKGESIFSYKKELYHSLTGENYEAFVREIADNIASKEAEKRALEEAEAKRIREEEEKVRMEEARKRAEVEQARLEAERIAREEEERIRLEAEAKRRTIFDDLSSKPSAAIDLDFDFDAAPAPQEPVAEAAPVEVTPAPVEEAPVVAAPIAEIVEEATVVETPLEEAPAPIVETPRAEEVKAPEPVFETPSPVVQEIPAAPVQPEPVAETPSAEENEFLEMAASMEPKVTPPAKSPNGSESFLDRFKAKQEEAQASSKPAVDEVKEQGSSILDKIQEKSQTVADRFSDQTRQRKLHESINGSNKIKLDEIPIHKQYQYVQKVFGGNNVRFRIIVDRVNDARDAAEVEDILNKFVLSIDDIDREDAVVQEFVELLRNRF